MDAWIDAFLPTFGLIALGGWLRARVLREAVAWEGLETLTFYVLLPSLLAYSISTVMLSAIPLGRLFLVVWAAILAGTAGALLIARIWRSPHPTTTSIIQGAIRFNTYLTLGIVSGLYGPAGLALGGVVAGLVVTAVQVVLGFAFGMGGGGRLPVARLALRVLTNPLLVGCMVGFAFAAVGGMPPGLRSFARALGQAALALGLLCVGAGLVLASLRERVGIQAAVGALKLVALPGLTLLLARAVGLETLPTAVAVMVMAMPTATTAYVMARALGGDARLMAATITLQHLAAALALPAWAALLSAVR